MGTTMTYETLSAHRDHCDKCDDIRLCDEAQAMAVGWLTEQLAPTPAEPDSPSIIVYDIPAHRKTCTRCTDHRLCHVARRIADDAATALVETRIKVNRIPRA
jgi:hypothetical protein